MDDLDHLLREAGARWRAAQPPPRTIDEVPFVDTRRPFGAVWRLLGAAILGSGAVVMVVLVIGSLTQVARGPQVGTSAPVAPVTTDAASVTEGRIIFGSPASPETAFRLDGEMPIAWTAYLAEPAEGRSVNLVISPRGSERELFGYRQIITDPGATTLVNEMPLGRFLPDPGVYVMRYLSTDGEVLAEGEFELFGDPL
jgi:hypothetical protein